MKNKKARDGSANVAVGTGDLVRLLDVLSRETVEIQTHPEPRRPGEKLWSVQIFPSDTGVCLAWGDTLHEAGWKAVGELEAKRS